MLASVHEVLRQGWYWRGRQATMYDLWLSTDTVAISRPPPNLQRSVEFSVL